jgi:hypothetical protein
MPPLVAFYGSEWRLDGGIGHHLAFFFFFFHLKGCCHYSSVALEAAILVANTEHNLGM